MTGINIAARISEIKKKMGSATLVAVSKFHSAEKIREAFSAGVENFGENYIQEALEKINQLKDLHINWHFIGNLQKNKLKHLVGNFKLIQSVDDLEALKRIGKLAREKNITQEILLQVNIGDESSKSGIILSNLDSILEQGRAVSGVNIVGLMCLPPLDCPDDLKRNYFRTMKKIFDKNNLRVLSMGTSHDFEMAIAEGATMIRIGTDIFGERPKE